MQRFGVFLSLVFTLVFSGTAQAQMWQVKALKRAPKKMEKQLFKILKASESDYVHNKDAVKEVVLHWQVDVTESYTDILYYLYKSKKPQKKLKYYTKHLSKKQIRRLKHTLAYIQKQSAWMNEAYVVDYIHSTAERFAKKEVQEIKRKLLTKRSIASDRELSRILQGA